MENINTQELYMNKFVGFLACFCHIYFDSWIRQVKSAYPSNMKCFEKIKYSWFVLFQSKHFLEYFIWVMNSEVYFLNLQKKRFSSFGVKSHFPGIQYILYVNTPMSMVIDRKDSTFWYQSLEKKKCWDEQSSETLQKDRVLEKDDAQ